MNNFCDNNFDRIVNKQSIWDLNVHTCKCPKGNSEFSKLSVNEYIDELIDIFLSFLI